MTEPVTIKMDKLVMDPEVQIRVRISAKTVDAYAEMMRDGAEMNPIEAFANTEGNFVIGDGAHRYLARQKNEYGSAKVIVHPGKLEDAASLALELSLERNCRHGLRLTTADKRNAIKKVLSDERMKKLGDRPIAVKVGVSPAMVKSVRDEMHAPPTDKNVPVSSHRRSRPNKNQDPEPEVDARTERIRTIRDWVQAGVLEWPDIRSIFETKTHSPTMMPKPPCKVVVIKVGKKRVVSTASNVEIGKNGDDHALIVTLED